MGRFKVIAFFACVAPAMLVACVHVTERLSEPASPHDSRDSNGLDERERNFFHVQNARMLLSLLAQLERKEFDAAEKTTYDLLHSELGLLNGFAVDAKAKPEHKGLCQWLPYVRVAKQRVDAKHSALDGRSKFDQLERTERILAQICK
jgi:hypothetical protein